MPNLILKRPVVVGAFAIALTFCDSLSAAAQSGSATVQSDNELRNAEKGDRVDELHLGFVYIKKRNYPESQKWFQKAANQGDGPAASVLHMCYQLPGLCPGWPCNLAESQRWYTVSQKLSQYETVRADDDADYNDLKNNFGLDFTSPLVQ
jgi:TPR repeat protein